MNRLDAIYKKVAAGEAGQYEAAILWQEVERLLSENAGLTAPATVSATPEIDMPQLIAQEILDDAFKPGGCCYRLNFTKMKSIVAKHWRATTQGTPEGK